MKTKRILALVIVLSLIASLFVAMPTTAATMTDAEKLGAMNLFRGEGDGLTAEYLAKSPDRKTAARLLLRFTGLEEASDKYTGTATFKDASSATLYWQPMIGYLKANPSAGFIGYEDGTFRPNDPMNAQAFYKVLLEVLGYKQINENRPQDGGDFRWDDVFTFAQAKGLVKNKNKINITNNDAAVAMVEALNAKTNDGEKLIDKLIADKIVTPAQAAAAGFVAINSITGYEVEYVMTYGGSNPLPKTVTANYSDGTKAAIAVTWSSFSTTVEGTYNVEGTIEGFGKITSKVTLTKTLMISEVYASSPKEITVTFNMAVPANTAVSTKFGSTMLLGLTQVWSTDRKTLKISRAYNFSAGKYTVSIPDSSKEISIENEKLTEIVIGATHVYAQSDQQDLEVLFYNQYGISMNPNTLSLHLTVISIQKPTAGVEIFSTAKSVFLRNSQKLEENDVVRVVITDLNSGTSTWTDLVAIKAPVITSFAFGEMKIKDSAANIMTDSYGHTLTVYASDQYGNDYKLRKDNKDISVTAGEGVALLIMSSDVSIVDASKINVDDEGRLYFKPGAIGTKGGNVKLTVIPLSSKAGAYTVVYDMVVYEPAKIDSLGIQGISGNLYAGRWVALDAVAYDQYYNLISLENMNTISNKRSLVLTGSPSTVIPNGNAETGTAIRYNAVTKKIEIYAASEGTASITIAFNNKYTTLSVTVESAPAPKTISAITLPAAFQAGAEAELTLDDITLLDNKTDSPISLSSGYYLTVTSDFGLNNILNIGVTSMNITAPNVNGYYTIVFKLMNSEGTVLSTYNQSLQVVSVSDITSYQIKPISTMYAKSVDKKYWKLISITGVASGKTVQLKYGANGLPEGIDDLLLSNSEFTLTPDSVTGRQWLKLATVYSGTASSISTTITAVDKSGYLYTTNVTATVAAPYMTTAFFKDSIKTLNISGGEIDALDYIVARDQYGVDLALTGSNAFTIRTTDSTIIEVNGTKITPKMSGVCIVRAVSATGSKAIEVEINVIQ